MPALPFPRLVLQPGQSTSATGASTPTPVATGTPAATATSTAGAGATTATATPTLVEANRADSTYLPSAPPAKIAVPRGPKIGETPAEYDTNASKSYADLNQAVQDAIKGLPDIQKMFQPLIDEYNNLPKTQPSNPWAAFFGALGSPEAVQQQITMRGQEMAQEHARREQGILSLRQSILEKSIEQANKVGDLKTALAQSKHLQALEKEKASLSAYLTDAANYSQALRTAAVTDAKLQQTWATLTEKMRAKYSNMNDYNEVMHSIDEILKQQGPAGANYTPAEAQALAEQTVNRARVLSGRPLLPGTTYTPPASAAAGTR